MACTAVDEKSAVGASEVVVTFEEIEAGLHVSFDAHVDLTGLSSGGFGHPLESWFFADDSFGWGLTIAASAASFEESFTDGSFVYAFDILASFNTTHVVNATGDNFRVAVVGTDLPLLFYVLPSDYVSNAPLCGSATFVDLSLSEVAPLLGTFPLDFDGRRTITFRASADLDADGDVDGADFLAIQRSEPDLISAWASQYGLSAPVRVDAQAVPEPWTGELFLLAAMLILAGPLRTVRAMNGSSGRAGPRSAANPPGCANAAGLPRTANPSYGWHAMCVPPPASQKLHALAALAGVKLRSASVRSLFLSCEGAHS